MLKRRCKGKEYKYSEDLVLDKILKNKEGE